MKMLVVSATVLASAACAGASGQYSESEMNSLASALTKLSSAVDGAVRYRHASPLLEEEELLKLATAQNPRLLAPFSGMKVKIQRDGAETVLLVCEPKRNVALLEDAACSARMEKHRWRDQPRSECTFTVDLREACR